MWNAVLCRDAVLLENRWPEGSDGYSMKIVRWRSEKQFGSSRVHRGGRVGKAKCDHWPRLLASIEKSLEIKKRSLYQNTNNYQIPKLFRGLVFEAIFKILCNVGGVQATVTL